MSVSEQKRDNNKPDLGLNLDDIVTTQPELGPSIPDGGWGWIVFFGTLFFYALIPCLIINFGILLAFAKLENGTARDKTVKLWDEKVLYVPLFYLISQYFCDSFTRGVASRTNSSRLVAVVGVCLTCAGLLFMWMGMTGINDEWLFIPAGFLSGLGSSIIIVECEIIMSQYFRLKLPILSQISQCVSIIGFLIAPVVLGHYILTTSINHVLLWYQAIILQGLVVALVFKKPLYLKSKKPKPYQFVLSSPDDEEDIFSKNSRELQIKRQTTTETEIIEEPQPSTSNSRNWEKFEDEDEIKAKTDGISYAKIHNWEFFEEEDDDNDDVDDNVSRRKPQTKKWEKFEDEPDSPRIINELSLADETKNSNSAKPSPLFADFPINNNSTYAYDDEFIREVPSHVFVPNTINSDRFNKTLQILKEATFYKTLFMLIANRYSTFVFYALFPSYLYIEATVKLRYMTGLVGSLSLINLIFVSIFYWISIDKKKRPLCFWIFYWMGAVGYFMISDFRNETALLIGAVQIIFSIGVLDYLGKPLLGVSTKGGTSLEYAMLTVISGLGLLLFVFLNVTFKTCFRLVAIMHFFNGALWLANFAYKRIRIS